LVHGEGRGVEGAEASVFDAGARPVAMASFSGGLGGLG